MASKKELLAKVNALPDDGEFAFLLFTDEEIKDFAEDMEIECSAEQAKVIAHRLNWEKSADRGITWDIIESYVLALETA